MKFLGVILVDVRLLVFLLVLRISYEGLFCCVVSELGVEMVCDVLVFGVNL